MSINVTVSGTAVGVAVSSGIGPAGFIVAPGTATNAFGTFQLTAGNGITITTTVGQFQIASYNTTQAASFAPVQSVAGRVGTVVLQAADITAGTFVHARIPTISYTALANVPTTFAPSAHTHSTTDVVSFTAAASAAAPVQSVQGRSGAVVLTRADITAAEAVHTHSTADIVAFTASASAAAPVQSVAGRVGTVVLQAADITAGTFVHARIPTISYTALSNTPTTFAPSAHTHSTTDVVSFTAAASAAAPVQSVQGRSGAVVLARADITAAAEVHTHSTADISGLTASFSQLGHTHAAGDIQSGVLDIARIPTIGYTALSGVPLTFAPSAHTHATTDIVGLTAAASAAAPVQSVAGRTGAISLAAADVAGLADVATSGSYTSLSNVPLTFVPAAHTHSTTDVAGLTASFAAAVHTHSTTDITGYSALPAQSGNANRVLSTDGTAATWATRYSVVDPVLVQGDGMVLTRDTSAGSITVAFAGGTSGIVVSSATPQPLGVAAAGTSADAARADHVHKLPTVGDITAAAAVHTHAAGDIQSGVLDIARIPTISFTALSNTAHSHATTDITGYTLTSLNGLSGAVTLAAGSNVTVSTAGSTITIAATGGGGGGGGASPAARSLHFVFRG